MNGSVWAETERIQDTVSNLREVLGTSGEGFDIDEMPFKDWADVIRSAGEVTPEQQEEISAAALSSNVDALHQKLFSLGVDPSYLTVQGTSSNAGETFKLSALHSAMAAADRPKLNNLKTLILKDVETFNLDGSVASSYAPVFTKIVAKNVGQLYRGSTSNIMGNVKEADFSGVKTVSASSAIFYGASQLETVNFSGLEGDSTLLIGNTQDIPKLKKLVVGASYTGSVKYIEQSSVDSVLEEVVIPFNLDYSELAVKGGATIKRTGIASNESQLTAVRLLPMHDSRCYISHDFEADFTWFMFNCGFATFGVSVSINGNPEVHLERPRNLAHRLTVGGLDVFLQLAKFKDTHPDFEGTLVMCEHLKLGISKDAQDKNVRFSIDDNGNISLSIT